MNFQQTSRYKVNIDEVEKFLEKRADDIEERSMHRRRKYHIDGIEVELVRPIDQFSFLRKLQQAQGDFGRKAETLSFKE